MNAPTILPTLLAGVQYDSLAARAECVTRTADTPFTPNLTLIAIPLFVL
jgi:hypothetical protein